MDGDHLSDDVVSVVAVALITGVLLLSFRILPKVDHPWRALLPGAIVAGVGFGRRGRSPRR